MSVATESPRKSKPLPPRRAAFVREYLVDLNGTQAAIRAGYAPKSAGQTADDLLRIPQVAAEVAEAMAKRAVRTEITQDRVIKEVARIAFLDIRKLFDANGAMKPIHDIDDETAAALASIECLEVGEEGVAVGVLKKLKLTDKKGALELLMRHMGMLNDKLKVGGDAENPLTLLIKQIQGSAMPVVANPPKDEDDE